MTVLEQWSESQTPGMNMKKFSELDPLGLDYWFAGRKEEIKNENTSLMI